MQTPVVLLSLPPAVRLLEIHVPCGGPVFEALQHCTGLREVAIFGDATGILCHGHGRHTVTKLRSLQLTCKRELYRFDDSTQNIVARQIPSDMFGLLLEASQLTHLTLSSLWSDDITSLCYQLPKLSSLRWASCCPGTLAVHACRVLVCDRTGPQSHAMPLVGAVWEAIPLPTHEFIHHGCCSLKVYECSPDDAEDVVAALERAHSITALCLGLCACHGVEDWRMADRMLVSRSACRCASQVGRSMEDHLGSEHAWLLSSSFTACMLEPRDPAATSFCPCAALERTSALGAAAGHGAPGTSAHPPAAGRRYQPATRLAPAEQSAGVAGGE